MSLVILSGMKPVLLAATLVAVFVSCLPGLQTAKNATSISALKRQFFCAGHLQDARAFWKHTCWNFSLGHHQCCGLQATLEEVCEADLLLHVLDASSPDVQHQRASVLQVCCCCATFPLSLQCPKSNVGDLVA